MSLPLSSTERGMGPVRLVASPLSFVMKFETPGSIQAALSRGRAAGENGIAASRTWSRSAPVPPPLKPGVPKLLRTAPLSLPRSLPIGARERKE